jgi:hypothetical protein
MPTSHTVQFIDGSQELPVRWMNAERVALPRVGITPGRTMEGVLTWAGRLRASIRLRAEWPTETQQTFQLLEMRPLLEPPVGASAPESRERAG